jgi:pimeloyl-ACP methyl ester carboxylesterase
MPSFHNGAVEIAYLDEGEGDPIILVHGFASSKNVNWVYPTWGVRASQGRPARDCD